MILSTNGNKNTLKANKILIPIIIMMGFIPAIVHSFVYNTNLAQFDWYPDSAAQQTDFFFAWKMIAIILVGVVMIAILLIRYLNKKEFLFENSFYFLMGYALFVAMSALFSNHKYWVAHGTYELFEPVWVVLIYTILCYYIYNYVQEEKQVEVILRWSGIGIAIVTVIGFFQAFGLDYFKTSLGKHLMTSTSWWNQLDKLSFNFAEKTSYTTLYNPNFLSFYFGMLVPLIACLLIAAKRIWQKALLIVAEILCLICLKGSGSDTGWMALALAAVILALVLLSRKKKLFVVGIAVVVIGVIAACVLANTTGIGQSVKNTIVGTYHMEDRFALNDIKTNTDDVELDIWDNPLHVSYELGSDGVITVTCKDAEGQEITTTEIDQENHILGINDERFANVQIQPIMFTDDTAGIKLLVDGIEWDFSKTDADGYEYLNTAGKLIKYPQMKTSHLFRDDAMSNRGHIWNKTIPLLGKHVFMGSGANTYMFEVQQEDYISQNYVYGANSYDVKAHCWYLQQWVETGLLGTLALLVFLFWYLVQSVRIYRRVDLHESISWVGFGLFAAVLVYMIVGIANDSNVCTAPMFWGMLGLGLATNRMIVEKEKLFAKQVDTAVVDEVQTDMTEAVSCKESDKEAEAVRPKKTSSKKQTRKQRKNQKK
jgi:O-antigen ligase